MNRTALAVALSALLAGAAFAGEAKVLGLHNCCPGCANPIIASVASAGGTATLRGKDVSISANDVDKAVAALFAAGYGGKVEGAKVPDLVPGGDFKATTIRLEGLHNCCGACANGIRAALSGFGSVDVAPRKTSVTVTAEKEVAASELVKALRASGYNARPVK